MPIAGSVISLVQIKTKMEDTDVYSFECPVWEGVSLPKLVKLFENSGKVIQNIEDFDTLSGCSDTGFVS